MKRGHLCINLSEEGCPVAIWRESGTGNSTCKGPGARLCFVDPGAQAGGPSKLGGREGRTKWALKSTSRSFCLQRVLWGRGTRTSVTLASHWFSQEFSSLTYKTGRCFLTSLCEAAEAMGRRRKDTALRVGGVCFPWALPCCHSLPSPQYLFQLLPLCFPALPTHPLLA